MQENEIKYTSEEVVKKLVGPILTEGNSSIDKERFENLKELCHLVYQLLDDIYGVAQDVHSYEHSVKKSGEYADKFLKETIKVFIKD